MYVPWKKKYRHWRLHEFFPNKNIFFFNADVLILRRLLHEKRSFFENFFQNKLTVQKLLLGRN